MYLKLYKEFETKSNLAYEFYSNNLGNKIIDNPREFHNFIASKRKTNGFPSTMHLGDNKASNPRQISYLFANHFQKMYCPSSNSPLSDFSYINRKYDVSAIEDVHTSLLDIDCKKVAGPDQISPEFLNKCADYLATPLHIIFNKSLSFGKFPYYWKKKS
jgi:hypothetical protein